MALASHRNDQPSPAVGPVEHRSEPVPDSGGRGWEGGAIGSGRVLLADLDTLVWCVQQLTALCDLIDSILIDSPDRDPQTGGRPGLMT